MTVPTRPGLDPTTEPATDDELIARWIQPDPHYPTPDRAWIADHAVSVVAVIGRWQAANGEVEEVTRAYGMPAEAVAAALAYYRRHQEVIDARITLNQRSFPDDTIGQGTTATDRLIARWVTTAPAFPTPDRARIVENGVSVTALITRLRGTEGIAEVARAYCLPVEAVEAAIAYYHRHQDVIDARITLNTARFTN